MLSGRSPTTWLIASFVFSVTLTAAGAAADGQTLVTHHPSEIEEGIVFGAEGGLFGQTVVDGSSAQEGVWGGSWVADLTLAWTREYDPEDLRELEAIPFRGPRWTRHWGARLDVSGMGSLMWLDEGSSRVGVAEVHNTASVSQSFELGLWLLSIGQTFGYQQRALLTDRVVLAGRNVINAGGFIDFQGFGMLTEDFSVEVLSMFFGVEDRTDVTASGAAQTGVVLTVDILGYGGGASWDPDEAFEHVWIGRTVARKYIQDQEVVDGLWRGVQALDFRFDFFDASLRLSAKESLRLALGLSVIKPEHVVTMTSEGEVLGAAPSTIVPELMLGVRRGGRWRMDNGRGAPVLSSGEPFALGLELASMHRLEATGGAIDVGGQGLLWGEWDPVENVKLSAEGYLATGKRIAELDHATGDWLEGDEWLWLGRVQAGAAWLLGPHFELKLEGWGEYSDREVLSLPSGTSEFRWQAGAELGAMVRY